MTTGADPNVRDWSGRKPRQYLTNQDTSLSADTYRSEYRPRDRPSAAVKLLTFGSSLPRSKRRRCAKKDAATAATADDLGDQQHRRRRHVLPSLSFSPKHSAADSPFTKGDKPRSAGGGDGGGGVGGGGVGNGGGGLTDTHYFDALYFSALP